MIEQRQVSGSAAWQLVLFLAVLSLVLPAVTTWRQGFPEPVIHDEFSYLLAGRTYAAGRLSNPPLQPARSFEAPHVLVEPSHMSKYPPGPALFLALGIYLGHPLAGAWVGGVMATLALYWFLSGFFSSRWTAGLVLFYILLHGSLSYFYARSYMPFSMPVIGACLLFGSVLHPGAAWSRKRAICFGLGLAVLAISRPLEGLLIALPLAGWKGCEWLAALRRDQVGPPMEFAGIAALPLLLAAGFILAHNHAVTGSATTFPYLLYQRLYSTTPYFVNQPLREQTGRVDMGPVLDRFKREYGNRVHRERAALSLPDRMWQRLRIAMAGCFFLPHFGVLCLAAFLGRRHPWVWWCGGLILGFVILTSFTVSAQARYAGVVLPAAFLLAGYGLAALGTIFRGRLRRVVSVTVVAVLLVLCVANVRELWEAQPHSLAVDRRAVVDRIGSGKHLVFVAYGPEQSLLHEWVYNEPVLDGAPIVWVHDLGKETNLGVMQKHPGRKVWRLYFNGLGRYDLDAAGDLQGSEQSVP